MNIPLLFWLLLPIAAASGWFIARQYYSQQNHKTAYQFSTDYLKGLNYLLNEQPDKAIDVFIKLINVDDDTVETHLALGVLFRRRGEVNRAIRIHQNLISKSALNPQQHALALLELGQDYHHAGLLDRAENLFKELIEANQLRQIAYHRLLEIYQQEQEWDKSILIAHNLARMEKGTKISISIAQYYCEQAELLCKQQDYKQAQTCLDKALENDENCVRASLLTGHIALKLERIDSAILAFQQVEHQDIAFLSEVIQPLQRCYLANNTINEFYIYLERLLAQYGGITPMLALSNLLQAQADQQAVTEFVGQQLKIRPSLRGLDHFIDISLPYASDVARDNLCLLKEITSQLLKNRAIYKCKECGFSGKNLNWQCPSCKQWCTTQPIQGVEGE